MGSKPSAPLVVPDTSADDAKVAAAMPPPAMQPNPAAVQGPGSGKTAGIATPGAGAMSGTILTSPGGLTDQATTARKSLLGV